MHRSKRGLTTRAIVSVLSLLGCGTAWAQDDGARVWWKAMDGTNIVAFQYLPFNGDSSDSQAFDPAHYLYPESKIQANVFLLTYARHLTVSRRSNWSAASHLLAPLTTPQPNAANAANACRRPGGAATRTRDLLS